MLELVPDEYPCTGVSDVIRVQPVGKGEVENMCDLSILDQ